MTAAEIRDVLLTVKGLGEKRVAVIIDALNNAMEVRANENSD